MAARREEERKKQMEWQDWLRLQEEEEEVRVRALEKQKHQERLTPRQERILNKGGGPSLSSSGKGVISQQRPRASTYSTAAKPPHIRERKGSLQYSISEEEEDRLKEWEEIKRRESENEERMLREQERSLELQRQGSLEEERRKLADAVERERLQVEARLEADRPRTASISRKPRLNVVRLISVEEEEKLQQWEEIKRRDSENEERMLRQLERDLELQRHDSLEAERRKLAEAVERERVEEEARLISERPRTASVSRNEGTKKLPSTLLSQEEESKLQLWEEIKR